MLFYRRKRVLSVAGRNAFTLVELMVTTVIIIILVGLLLPGLHWIRESTRALGCRNNLRVLAAASLRHEATHGFLPCPGRYGGSGGEFVGDPDQGFDLGQWGPWLYSILPYMGRLELWEIGAGDSSVGPTAHARRIETAVSEFNCGSRGNPFLQNNTRGYRNSGFTPRKARTDYGASRSSSNLGALDAGNWQNLPRRVTEITDGIGHVFLCGERYLPPINYKGGAPASPLTDIGFNDGGWNAGNDWDTSSRIDNTPNRDRDPVPPYLGNVNWYFGGPHEALNMAMCDGSVRAVNYRISPALFRQIGTMNDGLGTVENLVK